MFYLNRSIKPFAGFALMLLKVLGTPEFYFMSNVSPGLTSDSTSQGFPFRRQIAMGTCSHVSKALARSASCTSALQRNVSLSTKKIQGNVCPLPPSPATSESLSQAVSVPNREEQLYLAHPDTTKGN